MFRTVNYLTNGVKNSACSKNENVNAALIKNLHLTKKTVTLEYTSSQRPYCGTDYTYSNIPTNWTVDEFFDIIGQQMGWWISGLHFGGGSCSFNINYD